MISTVRIATGFVASNAWAAPAAASVERKERRVELQGGKLLRWVRMRIVRSSITLLAASALAFTLFGATGNRQVTQNDQSPSAETSIKLGTHTVTVEYNAPSARGRK